METANAQGMGTRFNFLESAGIPGQPGGFSRKAACLASLAEAADLVLTQSSLSDKQRCEEVASDLLSALRWLADDLKTDTEKAE